MNVKLFISKFLFPIVLGFFGLLMLINSLKPGQHQTVLFMLASIVLMSSSVLMILLSLGKISMAMARNLLGLFIVLALLLAYGNFRSIQNDIRYEKAWKSRYELVKKRLEKIREAQLAFREVKGKYCNNFDELIRFIKTDSVKLVLKIGDDEDTLAMLSKDKTRWLRDTVWRPVLGSKFLPKDYPLDSLRFIPFGDTARFVLQSGFIKLSEEDSQPVFEASAKFHLFLSDLAKTFDKMLPDSSIRVGSMVEPTTNGNWK